MKQKDLPTNETSEELPPYEVPTVATYSEADILAELGDAKAREPLSSLLYYS